MNLKPLHDRVLGERVEQEDRTKGGIIIPDTAQENLWREKLFPWVVLEMKTDKSLL